MNEFTGERVIPGRVETDLWNEHVSRYAFAARYAGSRKVLDIGCGSGYGTAHLGLSARSVVGLDISHEAVQYARQHYPLSNLRFITGSASALPLAPASFDLITAFEVIEHLSDWPWLIEEAARCLAPEGLFIVSTPNASYYTESRGEGGQNPFHVHEFEAQEFSEALSRRFPHVRILLQNRAECIAFYPSKTYLPPEAAIEASAGEASEAHFFLALCSHLPLDEVRSFLYLPRAANVLREREQHIAKLNHELDLNRGWLEDARAERATLHAELQKQKDHLEEQNHWALGLEREWRSAQERIVELQNDFASEQAAGLETARKYEAKVTELEAEAARRAEWALDTERRLTAEIENLKTHLIATQTLLQSAEADTAERTKWALELQSKLDHVEAQLAGARASRWVRTGRMFGVGPQL